MRLQCHYHVLSLRCIDACDWLLLQWNYDVIMAQMETGERLPDGDVIEMAIEEIDCIPEDKIAVSVVLVSPITW